MKKDYLGLDDASQEKWEDKKKKKDKKSWEKGGGRGAEDGKKEARAAYRDRRDRWTDDMFWERMLALSTKRSEEGKGSDRRRLDR